ncbi:MAG: hypothetical protein V4498_07275 [candidate division FCPU426 bacterium]
MFKAVVLFLAVLTASASSAGTAYPPTIQALIAHQWVPAHDLDLMDKFYLEVAGMLEAEKFAELEGLAKELRASKILFTNGDQASHHLYMALAEMPNDKDEPAWQRREALIKKWMDQGHSGESLMARASFDVNASIRFKGRDRRAAEVATTRDRVRANDHLNWGRQAAADAGRRLKEDPDVYYWMAETLYDPDRFQFQKLAEKSHAADPAFPYTDAVTTVSMAMTSGSINRHGGGEWLDKVMARPDGLGAEAYARSCVELARRTSATYFFKTLSVEYGKVATGFGMMSKRFPNSQSNYSRWIFFLCARRDWPTAQKYVQFMKGKFDRRFWLSEKRYTEIISQKEDIDGH